jgi:hypothetical protein
MAGMVMKTNGLALAREICLNQMRKENADAAQNKKRYDEPNHETGLDEKYAKLLGTR